MRRVLLLLSGWPALALTMLITVWGCTTVGKGVAKAVVDEAVVDEVVDGTLEASGFTRGTAYFTFCPTKARRSPLAARCKPLRRSSLGKVRLLPACRVPSAWRVWTASLVSCWSPGLATVIENNRLPSVFKMSDSSTPPSCKVVLA